MVKKILVEEVPVEFNPMNMMGGGCGSAYQKEESVEELQETFAGFTMEEIESTRTTWKEDTAFAEVNHGANKFSSRYKDIDINKGELYQGNGE